MPIRSGSADGPKPPPDDPDQSKRFEKAAKEAGVDAGSSRLFKKAVRAVAPSVKKSRTPK